MAYGPEQQLFRTVDRSAVTPVTTTYVNPVFEVVSSGGSTEYRHNLKAGNETVAVVRQGGSGPSPCTSIGIIWTPSWQSRTARAGWWIAAITTPLARSGTAWPRPAVPRR